MTFDTSFADSRSINKFSAVEIVRLPFCVVRKISPRMTVTASKTVVYQNGGALETANCNSAELFAKLKKRFCPRNRHGKCDADASAIS
jgi:hypothetical protein